MRVFGIVLGLTARAFRLVQVTTSIWHKNKSQRSRVRIRDERFEVRLPIGERRRMTGGKKNKVSKIVHGRLVGIRSKRC